MSRVSPRRRLARGGLALLAFAALGLGAAPSAGAAANAGVSSVTQQAAKAQRDYYTIRAVHSQKCLGTYGNWSGTNVQIVQQPCDGRPSQRFYTEWYEDYPGLPYHFIKTNEGFCLGTTQEAPVGSGALLYASLRTQHCQTNLAAIQFEFEQWTHPSPGYVIAEHVYGQGAVAQCLHVAGANTADNAGVIYHPCNSPNTGQRNDEFEWFLV
ncbi:RICIN domain-containing protein [Streptomyces sp. NPDC006798]|uniref:RICIN domain-containing protein n=1 Tax=Streptomyces sp. NPDC006798 TaxID=3155462 RepID=UPI00340AC898